MPAARHYIIPRIKGTAKEFQLTDVQILTAVSGLRLEVDTGMKVTKSGGAVGFLNRMAGSRARAKTWLDVLQPIADQIRAEMEERSK